MKAAVWTAYGPPEVLQVGEVEKPVPKENEVLIKIIAATVTLGDCELRQFKIMTWFWLPLRLFMGVFKPRIKTLGQEYAGVIESVGNRVTRFKPGDEVFGPTDMKMGAYAEYKCLPEKHAIVLKPRNLSFGEAATIPTGGINGLHFVRKGEVKQGDKVLINGAGGSIGTYATQIAKSLGAEITCVDSGLKLEMLRVAGADILVDYTKEDFTKNGKTYDVIIDIVGNSSFSCCVRMLNPNGRYVLGNPTFFGMIRSLFVNNKGKKVLFEFASYKPEAFEFLTRLLDEGRIKPVIDRYFSLDRIAEAHRYVDDGLKQGNVVIEINKSAG